MPAREIAALFNRPKPRQEWIDSKFVQHSEKSEEAWVELFIDLVYVVLLIKLGDVLSHCSSGFYFFKISVYFCSMCLTRQAIDEYANRFYSHDLFHKIIYLVYTLGVFIQVLNINSHVDADGSYVCSYESDFGLGFSVGFFITRISTILSECFRVE